MPAGKQRRILPLLDCRIHRQSGSLTAHLVLPWDLMSNTTGLAPDGEGRPRFAHAPSPGRRKLAFASRTRGGSVASRIVPPAPGSPGDPSLRGATLVFYDAAGSGEADLLTIKSGRAGLAYSLDEPHQGRIAVRLVLGTATVLCAEARARTSGTPPSPARFDRTGRFTGAPRTPPPPACPQVPVAG
jgi:hypothetical protein